MSLAPAAFAVLPALKPPRPVRLAEMPIACWTWASATPRTPTSPGWSTTCAGR